MNTPYEIHVLNNQADVESFVEDNRINDEDRVLLFSKERVQRFIEELQAASQNELIALVIRWNER
jgi:hypothetical protein